MRRCRLHGALLVAAVAIGAGCGSDAPRDAAPAPSGAGAETRRTSLRFEDATSRAGIDFRQNPGRTEDRHSPEIMGSGLAVVDVNRDGAPDLIFVDSGLMGAGDAANRLYLNDGSGRFTDRTREWSLPSPGLGMGVAAGDYDNDGWIDLYLSCYGDGDRLLRNTGTRFEDVTERAGLEPQQEWSTSAGFFDLEGDGDLDLFVVCYIDYDPATARKCYLNELHIYCTPDFFDPHADRLYRNEGNGTFSDYTQRSGINEILGKGLALALGDIDQDGDTDAYVANDLTRNQLYINAGGGRLEDVGVMSGAGYSEYGKEEAGMGTDLSDADGNGLLDIVCTNFQGETNSLYLQYEGMFFRESSDAAGIGASSRPLLAFGCDFFDADNDGDEDLIIANGHINDRVEEHWSRVRFAQPNLLFENRGSGEFLDVGEAAGDALRDEQVSRGLVTSDLDGDGDLDYVVSNNGGSAQVAFNTSSGMGNWVGLWLEGRRANRSAIGARVVARAGDLTIARQISGSSSYLSLCDLRVHLGIGAAERIDEITIYWPGGDTQTVKELQAGRYYRVVEGAAPEPFVPGQRAYPPE